MRKSNKPKKPKKPKVTDSLQAKVDYYVTKARLIMAASQKIRSAKRVKRKAKNRRDKP